MKISSELCIGCRKCMKYCPMNAISVQDRIAVINEDECVECEVCTIQGDCPTGALHMEPLEYPRTLRNQFSNPRAIHTGLGLGGRGTQEMKTNDVTRRYTPGMFGMGLELGRPGIGTRFYDIEKVAMALAEASDGTIGFEMENPVTCLMTDTKTGKMREDILNEKVLSGIVEFMAPLEKLPKMLDAMRKVANEIDTVFSVSLISCVDEDGTVPAAVIAQEAGFRVSPRTKTNVGLGRRPGEERQVL